MTSFFTPIEHGGVCSPKGFKAGSTRAGIKQSGNPDVTVLLCDTPARFAGAFTQNSFAAAPVIYCREICESQTRVRALAVNAGNANACTGHQGYSDAKKMAIVTADHLNISADEVLVFSTGRIGVKLPMDKVENGLKDACATLSYDGSQGMAEAIMTTDTVPKSIAVAVDIDGHTIHIGGTAKGAGMIAPQMKVVKEKQATMFCFMTTDARLADGVLEEVLDQSLNKSFNRITVDGDTSTNDSFVVMSSELADNQPIRKNTIEAQKFQQAFDHVAAELARWLIRDGEGVTKLVEVNVTGAKTDADAETCAQTIANSLLCKTAWFGADPNWGRILDAAGYSGIEIEPSAVSLYYEGVPVVKNGLDAGHTEDELAKLMENDEFKIDLNLGCGDGAFTVWTCDLSYDYVKINADYRT